MNPIVALAANFRESHPAKSPDYDAGAAIVREHFDAIVLTHPTLSKQGNGPVASDAPEAASTATEGETANEPPKGEETQDTGVQTADTAENADQEPPEGETEAEKPAETAENADQGEAEPSEVAQSEAEPADQGGEAYTETEAEPEAEAEDAGEPEPKQEKKPVAAPAPKGNGKKSNSKKGGRK